MSIEVRPFRRNDREQLTALVNAHAAAVIPGISVSVNTVLSQLEREPREFIVDPWVCERATLVAEQSGRVVAAAHLLRYASDDRVGASYRDAGEIRWCLFWPEARGPHWPNSAQAADALEVALHVGADAGPSIRCRSPRFRPARASGWTTCAWRSSACTRSGWLATVRWPVAWGCGRRRTRSSIRSRRRSGRCYAGPRSARRRSTPLARAD